MSYPLRPSSTNNPRVSLSRHLLRECDSLPNLLGGAISDMSKGFPLSAPVRFGKRGGLWIDSDVLPKRFGKFHPWNAKDGPDWRDESQLSLQLLATDLV